MEKGLSTKSNYSVRNTVNIVDKVHTTLDQDKSSSEDSEFELF